MKITETTRVSGQRSQEDQLRPQSARPHARRARPDPEQTIGIPRSEMTPTVQSAVMRLMEEMDRLKDELSEAQQRVVELESVADEDPLVPLLNRRGFMRELERAIAYAKRYRTEIALIYVDLDNFKDINDTNGHAAGDEVLRHIAGTLSENVRRSDIVGRIGGDEFAIVLQKADLDIARTKAAQLEREILARPVLFDGAAIPVAISAGAAVIEPDDHAATALERADRAMYAQKAQKRTIAAASRV